ncbi:MAG: hypothetical protein QOJ94_1148 [Sphingomonadales bacterium]|jgi:hypothetical protein|nr:hypothetical protein [Sphingomonadales bacterium]
MRYGSREFAYAEPFASELVANRAFRAWVLSKTKFASVADEAQLLHEEMWAARKAANWWRSHYTESCRCDGCRGQETDLLAIFQDRTGRRFALHVEVKQPTDRFPAGKDQAGNYRIRARCWVEKPPRAILPHSDCATALLCSHAKLNEYADQLSKFDAVITFEESGRLFPASAPALND